jgi:hypothetical protein
MGSRPLSIVNFWPFLTEQQTHRDAPQQGLNRMVEQHARKPVDQS